MPVWAGNQKKDQITLSRSKADTKNNNEHILESEINLPEFQVLFNLNCEGGSILGRSLSEIYGNLEKRYTGIYLKNRQIPEKPKRNNTVRILRDITNWMEEESIQNHSLDQDLAESASSGAERRGE